MRMAFIGAQSSHDRDRRPGSCRRPRLRRARRRPRRGVRGDRASHPRAARARPLRGDEVHDGPARDLVPPRDPAAGRPFRRHRRAVLLGARGAALCGRGTPRALHVGRRLRAPARAARRPRRRLGGAYRGLVDANQHVDREAAARGGIGFYGKNTMLITRRHGSWVVLGTLVTDVELVHTPPLRAGCGDCTICIDACPTGALDDPGTLDATKCLSYWTQAPEPIPDEYRAELGPQVYGCDICQDVCPWNRGVEKRRRGHEATSEGHVDLVAWLEADGRALVQDYDRLYVPRNDPRWLRRNALVALGNTGDAEHVPLLARYAADDDPLLAEHASWAL